MDNSILTGKYLRQILIENQEVMSLISSDKIFPLIANADTTFPFIVYSRNNLIPTYSKDGLCTNRITFDFVIVSDKYIESLDIANAVRHALETYRWYDNNIHIDPIHLDQAYEETLDDAYLQRLQFSFNVS